ncbi:cyclic nucleotide-binding/CBS domain-containing protein [Halorubrum rutilum]
MDSDDPLADVFVANVMTEPVETIDPGASAATAARRLVESDIGSILAGAESLPPDGILTESDFVALAAEGRDPTTTTVEEWMSSPVITVSPSDSIGAAARTMADRNVKKLPVVEPETAGLVGIVTTTDVARYVPVHEFHPEETG